MKSVSIGAGVKLMAENRTKTTADAAATKADLGVLFFDSATA